MTENMTKIPTAAALREQLAAAEVPESAISLALQLSASARHRARVEAAIRHAIQAAVALRADHGLALIVDQGRGSNPARLAERVLAGRWERWNERRLALSQGEIELALIAAALCHLEADMGLGGPWGAGGLGRSRTRGRWTEGLCGLRLSAWDAALQEAGRVLADAVCRIVRPTGRWWRRIAIDPGRDLAEIIVGLVDCDLAEDGEAPTLTREIEGAPAPLQAAAAMRCPDEYLWGVVIRGLAASIPGAAVDPIGLPLDWYPDAARWGQRWDALARPKVIGQAEQLARDGRQLDSPLDFERLIHRAYRHWWQDAWTAYRRVREEIEQPAAEKSAQAPEVSA